MCPVARELCFAGLLSAASTVQHIPPDTRVEEDAPVKGGSLHAALGSFRSQSLRIGALEPQGPHESAAAGEREGLAALPSQQRVAFHCSTRIDDSSGWRRRSAPGAPSPGQTSEVTCILASVVTLPRDGIIQIIHAHVVDFDRVRAAGGLSSPASGSLTSRLLACRPRPTPDMLWYTKVRNAHAGCRHVRLHALAATRTVAGIRARRKTAMRRQQRAPTRSRRSGMC